MTLPSIDAQLATLEFLARYIGGARPKIRRAGIELHAENLRAAIETLQLERERRLSAEKALARHVAAYLSASVNSTL